MIAQTLPTRSGSALARISEMRAQLQPLPQYAVGMVRAQWLFRSCLMGWGVRAYGHVQVNNQGWMELGQRLTFRGGMLPTTLTCHPDARLIVGARSHFNYGVSLEVWNSVRIGERCMFASFVRISDRDEQRTAPIVIEDDVWIAHGAILMPGVRIGARSVIAAGSIVTQDVPPDSLAMGNPARCMNLDLVTRTSGSSIRMEP